MQRSPLPWLPHCSRPPLLMPLTHLPASTPACFQSLNTISKSLLKQKRGHATNLCVNPPRPSCLPLSRGPHLTLASRTLHNLTLIPWGPLCLPQSQGPPCWSSVTHQGHYWLRVFRICHSFQLQGSYPRHMDSPSILQDLTQAPPSQGGLCKPSCSKPPATPLPQHYVFFLPYFVLEYQLPLLTKYTRFTNLVFYNFVLFLF